MKKANRASKPTGAYDVASAYTPTNGKEETRTESWSPRTGQYNFSIGWVFNE